MEILHLKIGSMGNYGQIFILYKCFSIAIDIVKIDNVISIPWNHKKQMLSRKLKVYTFYCQHTTHEIDWPVIQIFGHCLLLGLNKSIFVLLKELEHIQTCHIDDSVSTINTAVAEPIE